MHVCMYVCVCVCLFVYLSVCLCVCPSAFVAFSPSVCLSVSTSLPVSRDTLFSRSCHSSHPPTVSLTLTAVTLGLASDAFHVVMPSLPGYGFSGKPDRTGWGVQRTAWAFAALMARLGYRQYYAQGGDWGALVTLAIVGLRCEGP